MVNNRDRSPEFDDVEDLVAADTKHMKFTQRISMRQKVVFSNSHLRPKLVVDFTFTW